MNNKIETAEEKFLSGFNCAQAVLYAFCDNIGMDKNTALKTTCGFGAGMGRKQEICGAITGGIIAIGAKYGRGDDDDITATDNTYAKTRELMNRFQAKHGTCMCLQLLHGCNLMTEKGQKYFKEKDLKNKICKGCVRDVAQIVEEIFKD
jgi:C_GCAxxG_C_C family probable redox protein